MEGLDSAVAVLEAADSQAEEAEGSQVEVAGDIDKPKSDFPPNFLLDFPTQPESRTCSIKKAWSWRGISPNIAKG